MNMPTLTQQGTIDLVTLLGAEGTKEEQALFVDEFIDSIWQEVVDDAILEKMTDEQLERFQSILGDPQLSKDDTRRKLYDLLLEIVPDLSAQLQSRADALRTELFGARIAGLREFHKNNADVASKINEAEAQAKAEKWSEAVAILAQLPRPTTQA